MQSKALALVAITSAVAIPGCGGSSSSDAPPAGNVTKIGEVLDVFQNGAANRNGGEMCSVLSNLLKQRVEQQGGGVCDKVMSARLGDPYSAVVVTSLTIDQGVSRAGAQVVEKGGATARMFFVQESGRWLIDAIRRPGIGTPIK